MPTDADPAGAGIIILAAGQGQRFGADKRQARLPGGPTLLDATLARIPASVQRRLLVLRPGDEPLAERYRGDGWEPCFAAAAHRGMGHSLAAAMACVGGWPAALIGLGDMPYVRSDTYAALQQALDRHPIVVPVHAGRRGNPVGFRQVFFAEIATLEGDRGARQLLRRYAAQCHQVALDDPGIHRDVDTPAALRKNLGREN